MDPNSASRATLLTLDGVGPRLADDIIAHRPYADTDDLLAVPGIGDRRLERLREQGLAVDESETPGDESATNDLLAGILDGLGESDPLAFDESAMVAPTQQVPQWRNETHQTALPDPLPDWQLEGQHWTGDSVQQHQSAAGWADTPVQRGGESIRQEEPDQPTETPTVETERSTDGPGTTASDTETTAVEPEPPTSDDADPSTAQQTVRREDEYGPPRDSSDDDSPRDGESPRDETDGIAASSARPTVDRDANGESTRSVVAWLNAVSGHYLAETFLISGVFYLVFLLVALLASVAPVEMTLTTEHVILIASVPFIVSLIVSGKLQEIRGPGGVMVVLEHEAQTDVSPELSDEIKVDPAVVAPKAGIDSDFKERIRRTRPTTLSFDISREGYYDPHVIEQYVGTIRRLSPSFRHVVFTEGGQFRGFMTVSDFAALEWEYPDELVQSIENASILDAAGVVREWVESGSTNTEALERMTEANTDRIAVLDENRRFVGVLTQDGIDREILLKLLRRASP